MLCSPGRRVRVAAGDERCNPFRAASSEREQHTFEGTQLNFGVQGNGGPALLPLIQN